LTHHFCQRLYGSFNVLDIRRDAICIDSRAKEEESDQRLPDLPRHALLLIVSKDHDQLAEHIRSEHREKRVGLVDEGVGLIVPVIEKGGLTIVE